MSKSEMAEPVEASKVPDRGPATKPLASTKLKSHHRTALSILTALAFLTRFYGLSHPSDVVFDEAHIMRFVSWYLNRAYFFDVHPPFGRLVYALVAYFLGYDGKLVTYDVGVSYLDYGVPYLALRCLPALLSSITVSIIYLIMWESGFGVPACVVAAGLVLLDTAQIAQTRLIYLDAILCFSIVCSLLFYIKFSKTTERPFSKQWWVWLLSTGIALSCVISTKYVGLFTYLTIGTYVIVELRELWRAGGVHELSKHVAARGLALIFIPLVLYMSWFYIHFAILTRPGEGDIFMSDEFLYDLYSKANNKTMHFPRKWLELQLTMLFEANALPIGDHPYESRPYQWPFSAGGVAFWCSDPVKQQIYFVGNLPGWWMATGSLAIFAGVMITDYCYRARGRKFLPPNTLSRLQKFGGLFFLTWIFHYFPFYLMDRQLMLHSYLPAHLASTLVAGSLVDLLDSKTTEQPTTKVEASEKKPSDEKAAQSKDAPAPSNKQVNTKLAGSSRTAWIVCGVVLLVTFAFWCLWFPLTYGFPTLSTNAIRRRAKFGRLRYAGL